MKGGKKKRYLSYTFFLLKRKKKKNKVFALHKKKAFFIYNSCRERRLLTKYFKPFLYMYSDVGLWVKEEKNNDFFFDQTVVTDSCMTDK